MSLINSAPTFDQTKKTVDTLGGFYIFVFHMINASSSLST